MIQKIQDMNVENKKVLLRCDFNVPVEDNKIIDDSKIIASLETIEYLMKKNAKVILLSHFGKVKTKEDKEKNSLLPVANYLERVYGNRFHFLPVTRSLTLEQDSNDLNPGEILLLENTRFENIDKKLESSNDIQLSMYWASLADIFCLDAFGSAHRKHASTYGVAKFIPSCIGFLVQQEINMLENHVIHATKPFTILMGGAKVEDKVELIESLLPKCDHLLLTGGIANSCLAAIGFNVGESLRTKDIALLEKIKRILIENKEKIVLPLDAITTREYNKELVEQKDISKIEEDDIIYDIGRKTILKYQEIINASSTIFVNGTCGKYEDYRFANGTREMLTNIANTHASKIVGGGDGVSAVKYFKLKEKFDYLSTGGGATLEYIINGTLPAIENIEHE